MSIQIKRATIADKTDATQLYQEFINETHASQPKDLHKQYEIFINSPASHLSICYIDTIPVGFVEFRELPNKLRDEKKIIEITSLYVRKTNRQGGIGKRLIDHVANIANEINAINIVLYSGLELTDAHKFYEKVGFRKKAFYFGKSV